MNQNNQATHIIFSKSPSDINLYKKWIIKRRGPNQALLKVNNIKELPNEPMNTTIKEYIPGLCKHIVVRFKKESNCDINTIIEYL